ncbi:energy transducer TonB [Novosphingobium taihuense]|uniref:energy transducer TonB n=1 Tax=Novosphingobium taihuense TaxID=260085 RepID=UPI001315169A|nr:energy transducer TonB [Novosphingobium taihuense]
MSALPAIFATAAIAQHLLASTSDVLSSRTPWIVHYADDSCRLGREFGADGDKIMVMLDQFAPGDVYHITLAGKGTERLGKTGSDADVGFGPELTLQTKVGLMRGTNTAGEPVVVLGPLDLLNRETEEAHPLATAAEVAKIRELRIKRRSEDLTFRLGAMTSALAGMRTCTADLVKLWGLDPGQQQNLASLPAPLTSPSKWLKSSDYPKKALRKNEQALVSFRLMIDASGAPTLCRIQVATQSPEFKELTCELLMKRARFEPARDQSGTAVPSYHVNTVRWIVAD